MSDYNGWTNKETWLVNLWHMDDMPYCFTTIDQYHVEPDELKEAVTCSVEAYETPSPLPAGLLSDFINTCWSEVNWHELTDYLNVMLKEMEKENDK